MSQPSERGWGRTDEAPPLLINISSITLQFLLVLCLCSPFVMSVLERLLGRVGPFYETC